MPGVVHDPVVVVHEECTLYTEQPQAYATHLGLWHTLVEYLRRYRTHRLQSTPSSSHLSLHPIELSIERLAREHPALYLMAFSGL